MYHSYIKVLDMSHNNITNIGGGFFKPAELSLVSLNLAFNYLQVSYGLTYAGFMLHFSPLYRTRAMKFLENSHVFKFWTYLKISSNI